MVFRHKAPVSRIEGVVPVVPHHEVVILPESIARRDFTVYQDIPVRIHFQIIMFIIPDDPFIKRKVVRVKSYGNPCLRYPERSEIVSGPSEILRERKNRQIGIRIVGRIYIDILLDRDNAGYPGRRSLYPPLYPSSPILIPSLSRFFGLIF